MYSTVLDAGPLSHMSLIIFNTNSADVKLMRSLSQFPTSDRCRMMLAKDVPALRLGNETSHARDLASKYVLLRLQTNRNVTV